MTTAPTDATCAMPAAVLALAGAAGFLTCGGWACGRAWVRSLLMHRMNGSWRP